METEKHRIELRFIPSAVRLLEEAGISDSARFTTSLWDSLKGVHHSQGALFIMTIAPKDTAAGFADDPIYGPAGGFHDYKSALNGYQFGLIKKIWLEANGRKIPLVSYEMENSFGITPSRTFVLSFPGLSREEKKSTNLVLDDVVPGLSRRKIQWDLTAEKYD